jgi:hypothetical protein
MKVDSLGYMATIDEAARTAAAAEAARYDGWWAAEIQIDAALASLGDELNARTKRGEWNNNGLIDDEVLNAFAVVGTPEEAVTEIKRRYGDVATRIALPIPDGTDPERWRGLFQKLRA